MADSEFLCTFASIFKNITAMAKKYELPEEEPQMVSEAAVAYDYTDGGWHKMSVLQSEDETAEFEEIVFSNPKLYVTNDELISMGRNCETIPCMSADEAIRHFMSL